MAQMITDRGMPTEIVWQQDENDVRRLPGDKIVAGILNVPHEGGLGTRVVSKGMPAVLGVPGDLPGFYTAEWFLSPSDGITIKAVRYEQSEIPNQIHKVVEFMQWRHLRLIVDRGPAPFQVIAVPLRESACLIATLIQQPGTRTSDGKVFAWAAGAIFEPFDLPDKSPAGMAAQVFYKVTVSQSYLFSAPAIDFEPSASIVSVSVLPILTVSVVSSKPIAFPPPSFAADLKLVFAPRLTRTDQNRPAEQYPDDGRRNTNVVSVFCDTNAFWDRGIPGQVNLPQLTPTPPGWNVVFDYAEPALVNEIDFDAVVFPRSLAFTDPFTVIPSEGSFPLKCVRVGGQGEFDNVHIHPWVGFDDPLSASGTNPASPALVEAPFAADEAIHMHWRWGVGIPQGVRDGPGAEDLRRSFRGYEPRGNVANSLPGAPLIPSNQSLRVKIAAPNHDVSDPTGGPLDSATTVLWYSPVFNAPQNGAYTQFCGHGFAYAYRFKGLSIGLTMTNADLLDDPLIVPCYHSVRWDNQLVPFNKQRVPVASTAAPKGLSRNRIGTDPPVNEPKFKGL
jgi:hypothetical protein